MSRATQQDPTAGQHDDRRVQRSRVRLRAKGESAGSEAFATVLDISTAGILVEPDGPLAIGDDLTIELVDETAEAIVRWTTDRFAGCEFSRPISQATVSAAQLISPPAQDARTARTETSSSFGSNLREARRSAGITQRRLADDMRISCAAISNWEKGKSHPRAENLDILLDYFPQLDTAAPTTKAEISIAPEVRSSLSDMKVRIAQLLELDPSRIQLRLEIEV